MPIHNRQIVARSEAWKIRVRFIALVAVGGLALIAALPAAAESVDQTESRGLHFGPVKGATKGGARLALVIGNSEYASGAVLKNPGNDASDIATQLSDFGFDVQLLLDAGQQRMETEIRSFGERLSEGSIGLFYYAGHAVQMEGRNYLIPVDAKLISRTDVKYKAVDLGQLLDELDNSDNSLNIIVLDACRDNPFRGFRGGDRGLAKTDAPTGTIIAYATAPGSVAADGDSRNGVYTRHLLDAMRQPGISIESVFKLTRIAVMKNTDSRQVPWESSSLIGDFYFKPGDGSLTQEARAPSSVSAGPPVATRAMREPLPEDAARGLMAAYEAAYEERDIDRLSDIWALNPDQRSAIAKVFDCAEELELDLTEERIESSSHQVAIDLSQKIRFSGARCLVNDASLRAVPVTATLLRRGPGDWVITSILPRR